MGDITSREGRSAFRRLIQDSVPAEFQTRAEQLLDSVVFSAEPILREHESRRTRPVALRHTRASPFTVASR